MADAVHRWSRFRALRYKRDRPLHGCPGVREGKPIYRSQQGHQVPFPVRCEFGAPLLNPATEIVREIKFLDAKLARQNGRSAMGIRATADDLMNIIDISRNGESPLPANSPKLLCRDFHQGIALHLDDAQAARIGARVLYGPWLGRSDRHLLSAPMDLNAPRRSSHGKTSPVVESHTVSWITLFYGHRLGLQGLDGEGNPGPILDPFCRRSHQGLRLLHFNAALQGEIQLLREPILRKVALPKACPPLEHPDPSNLGLFPQAMENPAQRVVQVQTGRLIAQRRCRPATFGGRDHARGEVGIAMFRRIPHAVRIRPLLCRESGSRRAIPPEILRRHRAIRAWRFGTGRFIPSMMAPSRFSTVRLGNRFRYASTRAQSTSA